MKKAAASREWSTRHIERDLEFPSPRYHENRNFRWEPFSLVLLPVFHSFYNFFFSHSKISFLLPVCNFISCTTWHSRAIKSFVLHRHFTILIRGEDEKISWFFFYTEFRFPAKCWMLWRRWLFFGSLNCNWNRNKSVHVRLNVVMNSWTHQKGFLKFFYFHNKQSKPCASVWWDLRHIAVQIEFIRKKIARNSNQIFFFYFPSS